MRAKVTLIRDHWSGWRVQAGIALLWLWIANRRMGSALKALFSGKQDDKARWKVIWAKRHEWLQGY